MWPPGGSVPSVFVGRTTTLHSKETPNSLRMHYCLNVSSHGGKMAHYPLPPVQPSSGGSGMRRMSAPTARNLTSNPS
jgi:hypothetical protein